MPQLLDQPKNSDNKYRGPEQGVFNSIQDRQIPSNKVKEVFHFHTKPPDVEVEPILSSGLVRKMQTGHSVSPPHLFTSVIGRTDQNDATGEKPKSMGLVPHYKGHWQTPT
jgi:hypothetical protein